MKHKPKCNCYILDYPPPHAVTCPVYQEAVKKEQRRKQRELKKLPKAECPCHPDDYSRCRDPRCGSPQALQWLKDRANRKYYSAKRDLDYPPIGGVYNLM